jgi:endoglucanase
LWKQVVAAVGHLPHVWFGVANEPEKNYSGELDAQVWQAMNAAVATIREQEAALGFAPHIVSVQGTRNWARNITYYVAHPITAGGGKNVVYETHACECGLNNDARVRANLDVYTLVSARDPQYHVPVACRRQHTGRLPEPLHLPS